MSETSCSCVTTRGGQQEETCNAERERERGEGGAVSVELEREIPLASKNLITPGLPRLVAIMRRQQHVVAVPLPAQGHLNPLMRFCKLLASQGFQVTFVNIDPVHHRIQELLKQQEEEAEAMHRRNASSSAAEVIHIESIRRAHIPIQGLDLANEFRVSFQAFCEALNSIAPHLEDLIHKLNREDAPVTCLISDIAMTLPTQKVADMFGIPRIVLHPNSASSQLLVDYAMQGERITTKQVLEGLKRRKLRGEVFCEGLPGLPTLHNGDLPDFKHVVDDNVYMWEYFMMQNWQQSNSGAHAMVINSFEELEAPSFRALSDNFRLPVYAVGPLVEPLEMESSTSLWKEDEGCMLWLDKQPPLSVLFISFGSITLLSQPQFEAIVAALLSSQQRFLWVFRSDLVENVLYSSFSSDVASKFHGRGYVVDWAPQIRILPHHSVGAFITHCGWNSVIEAIAYGMPMLCWPYFGDQFLDAKYVVDVWKLGLLFEANEESGFLIEKSEIERLIKAVMEGEEGRVLRKNAMRFKEAGCQSLLPGGSSYKNIQTLIKSLVE